MEFKDTLAKGMSYTKKSITRYNPNVNLHKLGAKIVAWHNANRGLSYTMNTMYVVKDDPLGRFKKGAKHFEMIEGIKYRNIRFYKKETREKLTEILDCLDLEHPNQIGFSKGKGIKDMLKLDNIGERTKVKLDLSNAFDNITKEQLKALLVIVFEIRPRIAEEIATAWTVNGHMVQGHPLTPAIFNLLTRHAVDFVIKYVKDCGIIQYADDILIWHDRFDYVSWKTIRMVCKAFKRAGFPMNTEKEGFFHKGAEIQFVGLRYRKGTDGTYKWFPKEMRKNKARIRAYKHLKILGNNGLDHKIKGYTEWLLFRKRNKTSKQVQTLKGNWVDFDKAVETMLKLFPTREEPQWQEFFNLPIRENLLI